MERRFQSLWGTADLNAGSNQSGARNLESCRGERCQPDPACLLEHAGEGGRERGPSCRGGRHKITGGKRVYLVRLKWGSAQRRQAGPEGPSSFEVREWPAAGAVVVGLSRCGHEVCVDRVRCGVGRSSCV